MGDHETKNESEVKMDVEAMIEHLLEWNQTLENRVRHLETSLMALQVGAGDGSKHKNDGGWFD